MRKIFILNLITFLAAFLLFQIELIISKILLPQYGGSYLVWGACVVFFQAALFLGYLYSHIVARKIGINKYLPFHMGLLLLPLLSFPGRNIAGANYLHWNAPLVFSVFLQLTLTIGLVFFVLSTTSVILQVWLADSNLPEKSNPYILYALSNLGSFAALLSYPFLFELFLDLNQQVLIWRVFYFLFVILNAVALFTVKANSAKSGGKVWSWSGISNQDILRWFLFGAGGVIMFLSVTEILTYEVAPIPLLWVIPLCIYLLSFVLNFKQKPWCPSWITDKFYLTLAWSIVIFFLTYKRILPFVLTTAIYCVLLFNISMFCQYNLNKTKPAKHASLPLFYLIISFGGFIGGMFNTWVMPLISVSFTEYLLGLTVITLAFSLGSWKGPVGWRNLRFNIYVCAALILWPLLFRKYNFFGIAILFIFFQACYRQLAMQRAALFISVFAILSLAPFIDSTWSQESYIYRFRNYYGIYKIFCDKGKTFLMHGTTLHGAQFMDKQRENLPLTYYHPHTPVGGILGSSALGLQNVGLIGLGTGSLAAYAKPGQEFDYFEIDPDVYFIAHDLFTYLKNSPGKINYIYSDARLKIKEVPEKRYNVLVVDAFSGDSIPAHLLTTEAIAGYKKHLRDDGIILFHISNRYLNLVPVLFNNANFLNAYSCFKNNPPEGDANTVAASNWIAFTWDLKTFNKLILDFKWTNIVFTNNWNKNIRVWTDQYSNLVAVMKLRYFLDTIRYFQPFYWG